MTKQGITHILKWQTTPRQLRELAKELEEVPVTSISIASDELLMVNSAFKKSNLTQKGDNSE